MKFEAIFIGEKNPDWFSALIQWWQSLVKDEPINFSHAAILVNGAVVYDSIERGVGKYSLEAALDHGKCVIRERYELPVIRDCCALTWLERSQGVPYPQAWQLAGHFFPKLWRSKSFADGRRSASCSEYLSNFIHDMTSFPKHYFNKGDRIKPVDARDRLRRLIGPSRAKPGGE